MKKKSFIIFKDSLSVLEDLNDEQRGQLFYAIYQYQIGNEIELSPLIKIAFSPFKNQFMRDNEKWDSKSDERTAKARKAGIESARKRKELKQLESTRSTKSNSVVENQLNQPVTVNVTGSDSESVNNNIPTIEEWIDFAFEYAKKYYKNDFVVSETKVKSLLTNSYEYWEGLKWKKVKDWKRTAQNKVRKENEKLKDWSNPVKSKDQNYLTGIKEHPDDKYERVLEY